jgi:DNA invertase Pin-like site-specific DNA recombinase
MKAYLVCRQSKQTQSARFDGLDRQRFMCKEFCTKNNIEISRTLSKISSGWKGKYLKDLYSFVNNMNNNSILVTYRVDRFCRNTQMGKRLIELMRSKKIQVYSLYDGLGSSLLQFDFDNFIDCAIFEQLIDKAEKESLTISKRQKLAMSHKKRMSTIFTPELNESEIVDFFNELLSKNMTHEEIRDHLNRSDIKYKNIDWTTEKVSYYLDKNITSVKKRRLS